MRFAQEGGYHLVHNAVVFVNHERMLQAATVVCLLIVVASWLIPKYREQEQAANHGIDAFVLVLAAAHCARVLFSILSLNIVYDTAWYYVPGRILLALVIPFVISRGFLLAGLVKAPVHKLESVVALVALMVAAVSLNPYKTIAVVHRGWSDNWQTASYEGAQWMNANLPTGAIVGSADSGILGYFSNHQVVNLDGLVNSNEFLSAVKSQSVESWIKGQRIDYLANAMWTNESGCKFMANASGQVVPYSSPCTLIHQGTISWNNKWSGGIIPMRFQILGYDNLSLLSKR
jgi:hypothetical protein